MNKIGLIAPHRISEIDTRVGLWVQMRARFNLILIYFLTDYFHFTKRRRTGHGRADSQLFYTAYATFA